MRVSRLVGFGSICVSAGLGAWACEDEASRSGAAPDGGSNTPFDSGVSDTYTPQPDSAPPENPWCGNADGGVQSRCAKYQWDDFQPDASDDGGLGAPNCKACPGRALTCADLVRREGGEGTSLVSLSYDHYNTKTLTADLPFHAGEIVGGAVTVTHSICYGAPQTDGGTFTTQLQIEGNRAKAALGAYLEDGGSYDAPCGEITYELVDSCCTKSTVKFTTFHDPESSLYKTSCPDGG